MAQCRQQSIGFEGPLSESVLVQVRAVIPALEVFLWFGRKPRALLVDGAFHTPLIKERKRAPPLRAVRHVLCLAKHTQALVYA